MGLKRGWGPFSHFVLNPYPPIYNSLLFFFVLGVFFLGVKLKILVFEKETESLFSKGNFFLRENFLEKEDQPKSHTRRGGTFRKLLNILRTSLRDWNPYEILLKWLTRFQNWSRYFARTWVFFSPLVVPFVWNSLLSLALIVVSFCCIIKGKPLIMFYFLTSLCSLLFPTAIMIIKEFIVMYV